LYEPDRPLRRTADVKLYVTHDAGGTILSIALQAPGTDGDLQVLPEAGQFVSEVDVKGERKAFADEEKALGKLAEIAATSRVDVTPPRRKLVALKR
jgi:hypothetical protein